MVHQFSEHQEIVKSNRKVFEKYSPGTRGVLLDYFFITFWLFSGASKIGEKSDPKEFVHYFSGGPEICPKPMFWLSS